MHNGVGFRKEKNKERKAWRVTVGGRRIFDVIVSIMRFPHMSNPLVSIITVTYNAEKYVEQTIKSVAAQSYKNIEYIIIDGLSTDGTADIIQRYRQHITHFVSESDNGIYDAMNKGLQKATGELTGIINASDFYEPNAVEAVVSAYLQNRDAGIFYGNINMLNENGSFFKLKKPITNLENLSKGMSLYHPALFAAKSVYEKYGLYDLQYKIASDFDFTIRCYLAGVKFIYIDSVISNFRKGGISSKREKAAHLECKNVLTRNGYPETTVNKAAKEWERLRKKNNAYYESYKILKCILPASFIDRIAARVSVK